MPIHGYLGGVISATAPTVNSGVASGIFTLEEQMQAAGQGNWPGYQISRSVRLRSSASAYFNRTLTTPTNNKIWTFSCWFKRGQLTYGASGASGALFYAPSSGSTFAGIYFTPSDLLLWYDASGGATVYLLQPAQVFRDPSAWYHIVCAYDSTQATDTNRQKIYINGVLVTTFASGGSTYVAQNTNGRFNSAVAHDIGKTSAAGPYYFDGQMTEMNFIDGQALTPSSFGATDATTGVWNPIRYTGTYGTNGFYLNFSDPTSTTTIGYDYSGNSNNWTANNISVTSGSTYDSMVDAPTNYGTDTAGTGATARGNYAVLNPLDSSAVTVSNGNLRVTYAGSDAWRGIRATMPVPKTGSWKWEVIPTTMTYSFIGLAMPSATLSTSGFTTTYVYAWYLDSGEIRYSDVNVATGKTVSVNDVVEVRINNATVSFYKNNTLQWTFTQLLTDITPDYFPVTWMFNGAVQNYNFGQQPFVYTVAGYQALCTQNLPTATVSNGANYMAATIWTGNGASSVTVNNSVNNISFQPDFVWAKNRTTAVGHSLYDSIRGAGANTELNSASTNAEGAGNQDQYGYLSAFNSNGFTGVNGSSSPNYYFNESGSGFVGWQWKGGGTGVSNTAGSITSTVSANTTAGFSVVTYTGNGTSGATIGHGLGATASFIILKRRDGGSGYSWYVQHPTLGPTKALFLDSTNGAATSSGYWNNTAPTSTVFSVGNDTSLNASSGTYVAYCWSQITGYSAFITYTGNGSGDGPFVYCGFRPRYLVIKRYDSSGDPWWAVDSTRSPYNQTTLALRPNSSNAEDSGGNANFDFLANGFKARTSGGGNGNESGATYIVAAFAENPFTISRAR